MMSGHSHDPAAMVILWVTLIFSFAIAGRYLAKRFNQPGVLGELLMGVVFGNVCYLLGSQLIIVLREGSAIYSILRSILADVPLPQAIAEAIPDPAYARQMLEVLSGSGGIECIKVGYILDIFSRYGVIFLLFMVGLESSVQELANTGKESLQVAVIGVLAPTVLGFITAALLMPEATYKANLFVAAALSATSIGITARVLSEMKKLRTREARTILGAAMIDDILGLIILAIVSSIVISGQVNFAAISQIIILTILFFVVVLVAGPWVLKKLTRCFQFLALWEAKLAVSFIFVMFLSWLATVVQLASIIGAFAAGLIIKDHYFAEQEKNHSRAPTIKELVAPLEALLAPLFFMLIGIQVKLETFLHWQVLLIAGGLIVAAVAGKLISGVGGNRKDDKLLIGIGMLPRGEVGLVFASIGRTMGVMSDQLFSAIILMVIATTIITPPLLKSRYQRHEQRNVQ
ncbi:cation:proton antiporter [Legionella dresdenensis]|uniref:Cation:proton antiporter n=1 Tax=Legionella dresdenensis TaxID=450200 RepID=A0ABV8CHW0_9GAMM